MKLNIKKLNDNAKVPTYGSDYAAGLDLYSSVDLLIPSNTRKHVSTGISIAWNGDDAKNYYLRIAKIVVLEAEIVDDDFHARFKAKARSYQYLVINRHSPLILEKNRAWHIISPLDEHKMQEAANFLIGKHDFSSFRAKSCQAKSPLRTLEQIKISRDNEKVSFFLKAPSFLHHMVRNIV